MEDLIAVLPFGGTFDLVRLKGSTLRKAFEHSVRRYGEGSGEFLQVSGRWRSFPAAAQGGSRPSALIPVLHVPRQGSTWSWTCPNLRSSV